MRLRVVVTTFLLSAVVLLLVGFLAMGQISEELVSAHRSQALREVEQGQQYATHQLDTLGDSSDPALDSTLRAVVANLSGAGMESESFAVMIGATNARLPSSYVALYEPDNVAIPAELQRLVTERHALAYQYTRSSLDGSSFKPFLAVSTPVESTAGEFTLSYLFPLDKEAATIDLVRKAMISMGFLVTLLLAGVAYVVTFQVVTPVRLAADIAEKFASGRLEERMEVRGSDELARLATSFNRMAENLHHHITRLESLSTMQQRFTSDVSHELRTPLTTIRMASDVLHAERASFTPQSSRSAELLARELARFEGLLGDLLEISRYDSGAATADVEPTDLSPLLARVAAGFEALAEKTHTPIHCDVASVVADVDPRRIERIIRNLLGNAIEYGAGLPVRLCLAANDTVAAITVRDHGTGLAPQYTKAVFDRFWRADPSRARTTGGTGLGLAIAMEDALIHRGRLEAWGKPHEGALFRLVLPLNADVSLPESEEDLPLKLVPDDMRTPGDIPVQRTIGHDSATV